ncbi:right-handed parallel beta-helix repeat-containing protein [Actinoplanes sp. G11-F43]|uniref:right-handed parallel beta-helix repeat-containing protein n=1 Tax=Actinoplanes sp. G11-F43 TaxID=3424130 RepID=UPI003D3417E7
MRNPDNRWTWTAAASVSAAVAATAVVVLAGGAPATAARVTATCANAGTDAATIQSAINGSATGDEIVIDGPCQITQTITLVGNRSYRGDSAGTTLTQTSGSNLAAVLASDSWVNNTPTTGEPITLRDLTVNANKAGNPTGGDAVVIRSWNTTIESLRLLNAPANGLRITNQTRNGTALTNTQVNGTVRNLFVTDSGASGVYVQDSGNAVTDWNLTDNWVASSGGSGIRMENAAGWNVERNHVYGVGGSGITADRLFATSVSDNYIEDFNTNGIRVTVQGDAASTVSANRIFRFSGTGTTYLAIQQVNYGSGFVAVTGNVIRGAGSGTGLSYQRGSNALTVTSTGNLVTGVTTPLTAGSGVTVTAGI